MTLKTRKPTGAVPWPLILLEGGEKSGKTYACAVLSASPRVGRTAWLDLGEGSADEYGTVPGARYEVIDHDGTWQSIIGQVADAKAEAQADAGAGKLPFVLVVDTMTAEWEMLKDWASDRARLTDSNKAKLARDPNAEVSVSMNFWNDASSRHRKLMTMLMTFPGIVVVTARGKDVAALNEKGVPIEGTKEYRVEGNKNLAYDASCWVRMFRDKPAVIVGARSVHAGIRPGKDRPRDLDPDWTLEGLVFDVLQCDPAKARVRDMAELRAMRPAQEIADEALLPETRFARVRELYAEAFELYGDEEAVAAGQQEREPLLAFLKRAGDEKRKAGARPAGEFAWVSEWRKRLAGASTAEDAGALAEEVTRALGERKIQAATSSRLTAEARARQAEIAALASADPAAGGDDGWLLKIRDIASLADAEAVEGELRAAFPEGHARLTVLLDMLTARLAEVAGAGEEQAA